MITDPFCPVCDAVKWEPVRTRVFRRADVPRGGPHLQHRFRVLFELWCPGQDEVKVTSVLCGCCGFLTFAPRPSEEDIERKYTEGARLGTRDRQVQRENPEETQRVATLSSLLAPYLPRTAGRLLDVGGADGRFLFPFLKEGHQGDVVDYFPTTLPGIRRLGSTVADLPHNAVYDLVVCSHVLEHVATPSDMLSDIHAHLKPGQGILYVEVPMEVWRVAPPHTEPVTHINFFTPTSLAYFLARMGYDVLRLALDSHVYAGRRNLIVRAVARAVDGPANPCAPPGPRATRRLLSPSPRLRLKKWWIMHRPIR